MKVFRYRAKKGPAEVVEGVLQAESEEEIINKINDMGLVPVQIHEESADKAVATVSAARPVYRALEGKAVTVFYKQLGRIIKSGIPLLPALALVAEQIDNARLKQIIEEIKKNVGEGHPLSRSLADYSDYFSPFDLAVLEAGEMTGHLEKSLSRIAGYRQSQEHLMSKVRGALAYPLFILTAGFGAAIFMLSYVIPKFSAFFLNLGQELPLVTRLLIRSSLFFEKAWPAILAVFILIFFIIRRSLRADIKQLGWHRFYLGLPKIGKLVQYSQLSRFARTLALLIQSGIPLLKAVQTALPVLTNQAIRLDLENAYGEIKEGGSFGEALRKTASVPLFAVHLIRVGEESGRLEDALEDIALWYEQELEEHVQVMTALLEPILILIVGALLGIMMVAVLLPVFSINATIS